MEATPVSAGVGSLRQAALWSWRLPIDPLRASDRETTRGSAALDNHAGGSDRPA
jgi:hypothetical protein